MFFGFFVLPAFAFTLGYFPVVNRLTVSLVSPYARADVRKRLYAAAVDSLVVATLGVLAQILQSPWFLAAGAMYLLLRDSVQGQSLGKVLFGLVVISLETGQPATLGHSLRRNLLFLLPGANVAAAFLEPMTIMRDVQGQRLGDRLAHTQVIEGFGARDLVKSFVDWLNRYLPELGRAGKPRRRPATNRVQRSAEREDFARVTGWAPRPVPPPTA
jgi:uncharacterized RDD family membrane protein YckC